MIKIKEVRILSKNNISYFLSYLVWTSLFNEDAYSSTNPHKYFPNNNQNLSTSET